MGGERIALSGVETERCNLYFTSIFRPAGQLSLLQASRLTPPPRKSPARCPTRAVLSTRVDDTPPPGDSRNASQRRLFGRSQEVCGWIVRPWDRRDGSTARDEGRGRIDHLLHLQQQCLGLRTN